MMILFDCPKQYRAFLKLADSEEKFSYDSWSDPICFAIRHS